MITLNANISVAYTACNNVEPFITLVKNNDIKLC